MRLEGTLDAFGLPDIFQLLSFTRKTGALELRQDGRAGVVHVRDGAICAASSDVTRQQVVRRLIGAGLVHAQDVRTADADSPSLLTALVAAGSVGTEAATAAARDQAFDSVFDLLRWTDGEFSFVMGAGDPDELGLALPVEEVVAEARRRREQWDQAAGSLPAPADVLRPVAGPPEEIRLGVEEWSLLTLVDGRRTVRELVDLVGRGEFWTASRLGAMVDRGLLVGSQDADGDPVVAALAELVARESGIAPAVPFPRAVERIVDPDTTTPAPAAASLSPGSLSADTVGSHDGGSHDGGSHAAAGPGFDDAGEQGRRAVVPPRSDAIIPRRRPDFPEPEPLGRHARQLPVEGTAAIQPLLDPLEHDPIEPTAARNGALENGAIEHDPGINTSLLLRLIAGVRGL